MAFNEAAAAAGVSAASNLESVGALTDGAAAGAVAGTCVMFPGISLMESSFLVDSMEGVTPNKEPTLTSIPTTTTESMFIRNNGTP